MFIFACRSSDPTTLVDELRVMAIQSEPAEIGAEILNPMVESEEPVANILISDPVETGGTFVAWTCTNFGEGCLEKELYAAAPQDWLQFYSIDSVLNQVVIPVHPAVWGVLAEIPVEEQPFRGTFLWVLACESGVCPAVDALTDGNYDIEFFADPFGLMEELPITGTSLSFRPLVLSSRPEEARIRNPEITPLFEEEIVVKPAESTKIPFSYSLSDVPNDDSLAYAFTTLGGFATNDRLNNLLTEQNGDINFEWFGPEEEQGTAELYIVIEDGLGGSAIWTGSGEVR